MLNSQMSVEWYLPTAVTPETTHFLDRVESDPLRHHVAALRTPDVERRLKTDLVCAVFLPLVAFVGLAVPLPQLFLLQLLVVVAQVFLVRMRLRASMGRSLWGSSSHLLSSLPRCS